jgi:lipopolysaccharide/colanic/teichoic acid biosynthesis glycosyltransferase
MYKSFFKRLIDLIFSTIGLVFLFPIIIPVILILRFTGEKEVFYSQERIGFKNKKFKIFKFATMVKNSPNLGTGSLTLRNDSRVLPFGKFLRKTKINELPQIFNVINGSMSIVGPRPQMEVDFLVYPENVQKLIYNSKPGITGIGSIIFRDEENDISKAVDPKLYYREIIAPKKGTLELWYLKKISLSCDLKLIFITAWVIIFPESKIHNFFFSNLP